MTNSTMPALIAFFALGANLIGTLLLLMMNPRSRSLRGYAMLMGAVCVWLFMQGVVLLGGGAAWRSAYLLSVAALPGFFLTFALLDRADRPAWHAVAALAVTAALAPIIAPAIGCPECSRPKTLLLWIVMIVGWLGGSMILRHNFRHERGTRAAVAPPLRQRLVVVALLVIAPISTVAAIIAGSTQFPLYVIPFITVAIQILVFYGVTRMQFYQIDVRVQRSGEVAAQTLETERLAVVGELAATVAHEVRNPLTGMRSLAQRIAQEDVTADKRKRYGEVILEEAARVERLVDNLLELSRRGGPRADEAARTPLAPLFEDLNLLTAARAERGGVELLLKSNQLIAQASREALLQALLNLLLNAIGHSPRGGRVEMIATSNAGRIDIAVRDQGKGVPPEDRDRIFDPFYSTSAQGTGLGLSIVRHLAREHGWRIAVADGPGGGAQFNLSL